MSDAPGPRDPSGDDALLRRLFDGMLSPDEFDALQARLVSDPDFRTRYVHLVDLEAGLYEASSLPDRPEGGSRPSPRGMSPRRFGQAALLIALGSVCAVAAMLLFGLLTATPERPQQAEVPAEESGSPENVADTPLQFRPLKIEDTPPVAVLTYVEDPQQAGIGVGTRLHPGTLTIRQGRVQLDFFTGARVSLEGPAELLIVSKDAATLLSGRAAARVPDSARGFVLKTPEAAVVDLGTEFGVTVAEDGATDVEVLEGEVEVSRLGDDGNTLHSLELAEAQRMRVDATGIVPAPNEGGAGFPAFAELSTTPLPVTPAYVDAIRQSGPVIYWRFEEEVDGQVPNEMSPLWPAGITRGDADPDSLQVRRGFASFHRSASSRYVAPSESLAGFNDGPFTIEMWIRPAEMNYMTCLSIVPEGDDGENHITVIEVANRTHLFHEPGSLRFLHRFPPSKSWEAGTNLFAGGTCIPGQWQHVVAVKGDGVLELYSNGELRRSVALELTDEPDPYQLYLGQLRMRGSERQFIGAIDEFALYDRALTAGEVEAHYRLIDGAAGGE
ncbi:MAG: LamG-like jellyroll fold domain-containing protein [Maioricimonas sp. JB045]